jgi:hypothetical protein
MSERRVTFTPAWDKRDLYPRKNFGVHGVEVHLTLLDGDWALELIVMTVWMLPKTREWWATLPLTHIPRECINMRCHYRNGPRAELAGMCTVFKGECCQSIALSFSAGDPLFETLVAEGEEPFWNAMASALAEVRAKESGAK